MKAVIDLIREFAALNDAKIRLGGALPVADETRWVELKAFYNHLMSQNSLPPKRRSRKLLTRRIRKQVTPRERLRVPAKIFVIFHYDGQYHPARVVNLSRRGVFVASDFLLNTGLTLTLHLTTGGRSDGVFEVKGEVVWRTERGIPEANLPRGMGIRLLDLDSAMQERFDSIVFETLEKRISSLW